MICDFTSLYLLVVYKANIAIRIDTPIISDFISFAHTHGLKRNIAHHTNTLKLGDFIFIVDMSDIC